MSSRESRGRREHREMKGRRHLGGGKEELSWETGFKGWMDGGSV